MARIPLLQRGPRITKGILHGAEDEVGPLTEVNTLIGHLRAANDCEYKAAMTRFLREVFGQEVAQK